MPETVKLPTQQLKATFSAAGANRDERTIPMTFYTGAKVVQFNFDRGLHNLQMAVTPSSVRLEMIQSGRAPFKMGHSGGDAPQTVIGVISNARIENGDAVADVRFSKRAEVEPIYQDVLDGILANVSVEAALYKIKEITKEGEKMRSFLATDWEPMAVALVAQGADPNARINASLDENGRECEVEFAVRATSLEEQSMPDSIVNTGDSARDVQLAAQEALADQLKAGKDLGVTQELARVTTINKTALALNLPASFSNKHIEARTSVDDFRRLAIDEQARISISFAGSSQQFGVRTQVLRDEADTRRELMGAAVFGMLSPKDRVVDSNNHFIGLSILQIAQESVRLQYGLAGVPTKQNIANLAMQATADFTNVLENSARKQLQARYEYANPTYRMWTKKSTTPDFKTMSRPRLGEVPQFLTVPEGAQITLGTMSDSKETYGLATYGRGVSFTRQMLINDDLNAFNDLIGAFGVQAARLENKTVYAILTANAAMSDSVTLFHATHGNSGTGVIGNTALDAMFTAMAVQKGIDGISVLNLSPRFLIVPKAKESTARAALMQIGPNVKASDQNWFSGRLEPIADAELDGTSTAVWYGACDPATAAGIEYAHLEGAEGPQFIRKDNESGILGIQFYAFIDFAAKALDWRPLYYSTGA